MTARAQDWPAWRYGPGGEAQIFQQAGDVPQGWVDHPGKLPPVEEKQSADSDDLQAMRAEKNRVQAEFEAAARDGRKQVERLTKENDRLRTENERLQMELATALGKQGPHIVERASPSEGGEQPQTARRGPRKLTAAPVTAADTSITLDEGRTERLRVLREAGVSIKDDATDGDIEEALDWLEKQERDP